MQEFGSLLSDLLAAGKPVESRLLRDETGRICLDVNGQRFRLFNNEFRPDEKPKEKPKEKPPAQRVLSPGLDGLLMGAIGGR